MIASDPGSARARPPQLRSRSLYRAAYAWAALGLGWLIVSGRLLSYWRLTQQLAPDVVGGDTYDVFFSGLLLVLSLFPLLILAYDLGSQSIEARRLGSSLWVGLQESWLVAWRRPDLEEMAAEFAEAPRDDPAAALVYGLVIGATPLTVFLRAIPSLRTGPGVLWVGGAGFFMGVAAYCFRRAAAYLRRDPGRWSMTRRWSLLNVNRYEPAGRTFVWVQIACMILLPIWWIYGAPILAQ